jgi:hypothetical protein
MLAKAALSRASMPFPKTCASSAKKAKIQSAGLDLPSVRQDRQSVMAGRAGRLPDIVVPLPQCRQAISSFTELRQKLANAQISCCNIQHNRI